MKRILYATTLVFWMSICAGRMIWAQADNYGPDKNKRMDASGDQMHFVLVMKSHFDIGYSALARDVVHEYRTTMIDRALETMERNAKMAGPGEQFVWTIPGWPMEAILWDGQNPTRRKRIEQALKRGNLVMQALPFTLETATADVETLARSFIHSSRMARRYGLPLPNDAKMTDVPGHDWIVPTLLHHAGVKIFHFGSNPTNQQVKVPRVFWWEGPDGSRVLTMYSSGYDTGLLPPADWKHKTWLAMVMGGDNEGPPTAERVREWIGTIRAKFPNAKITVGRMEDFADSLLAEKPDLPVIRGNVSDSWIHGLASSPQAMQAINTVRPKLSALEALRTQNLLWGIQFRPLSDTIAAGYENSLRWSEHTWGLANQHFVPGLHGEAFQKAFAVGLPPNYERMEESWKEHDRFAFGIEDAVAPSLEAELHTLAENVRVEGFRIVVYNPTPWPRDGVVDYAFPFMGSVRNPSVKAVDSGEIEPLQTWGKDSHRIGRFVAHNVPPMGYKTYVPVNDATPSPSLSGSAAEGWIENKWFRVTFDPARGCVKSIVEKVDGREWVDAAAPHGFGQYLYQQFSRKEAFDYTNRYILEPYRGSHGPITAKSVYVPESAKSVAMVTTGTTLQVSNNGFSVTGVLSPPTASEENCHQASLSVTLYESLPYLDLSVNVTHHPATENPEAGWLCLPFAVDGPQYRLRGPGSVYDPARDMIEGGNQAFFWTQGGMAVFDGAGRGVGLCSPDTPALSLGEPGIYRFQPTWDNPKSRVYVHMFNNVWNTNFRSFWEGKFGARVRLWPVAKFQAAESLVTPSEETLHPLLTGLSNYHAGQAPTQRQGLVISRKGVTLTSFGPNPDGEGTFLRVWEQAGTSGELTITLPDAAPCKMARPVDLRGEKRGEPIVIEQNRLTFNLSAFAPASFILE